MNIDLSASYLRALKGFIKNNRRNAENTKKALTLFRKNPQYPSLNLEKLKNTRYWSIRIDKANRIFLLWIDNSTVLFVDIGKHDKYRKY